MKFLAVLLAISTASVRSQRLPLHLEKVLEISLATGGDLVQVSDAKIGEDGSIYVADRLDYTIKRFGRDGRLIASFGKQGKGPGEFKGPMKLAVGGRLVAVTDYLSPLVRIFDNLLNLKTHVRSSAFVYDVALDEHGRVFFSNITSDPDNLLSCHSLKGTFIGNLHSDLAEGSELFDSNSLAILKGAELVVAYFYRNRIEIFDSTRSLSRVLQLPKTPEKANRRTMGGREIPTGRVIVDADTDGRGNLLVLGGDFSEQPWRTVHVFSQDTFHGTFHLPKKSGILSARGDLLLVADQSRTSIVMYKLKGTPWGNGN